MTSDDRWSGPWGTKYAEFFVLEPAELDEHWVKTWDAPRSEVVKEALAHIPKSASILEVGCGTGNQLQLLKALGFTNLTGIEINVFAANKARERGFDVQVGTLLEMPYGDKQFDLVISCGVISHIDPDRLDDAIKEVSRVARKHIFVTEYTTNTGSGDFMWANDYAGKFTESDPALCIDRYRRALHSIGAGDLEAVLLTRKAGDYE